VVVVVVVVEVRWWDYEGRLIYYDGGAWLVGGWCDTTAHHAQVEQWQLNTHQNHHHPSNIALQ
jgi:hypothetical protein